MRGCLKKETLSVVVLELLLYRMYPNLVSSSCIINTHTRPSRLCRQEAVRTQGQAQFSSCHKLIPTQDFRDWIYCLGTKSKAVETQEDQYS